MSSIEEMQRNMQALQQRAASNGDPRTVQQEALKIRNAQEAKIEALLTDAQKQQWKQMLGKPLKL